MGALPMTILLILAIVFLVVWFVLVYVLGSTVGWVCLACWQKCCGGSGEGEEDIKRDPAFFTTYKKARKRMRAAGMVYDYYPVSHPVYKDIVETCRARGIRATQRDNPDAGNKQEFAEMEVHSDWYLCDGCVQPIPASTSFFRCPTCTICFCSKILRLLLVRV